MRRAAIAMHPEEHLINRDNNESGEHVGSNNDVQADRSIRDAINKGPISISDSDVSSAIEYLQKRRLLAITDSLLMIRHAAENGLDLKKVDVQAILDMASKINVQGKVAHEDHLPPEIESKFWEASSRISNLIKPASAAALRERSYFLSFNKSLPFLSTINRFQFSFWVIFAGTLLLHLYYSIIGAMIADAKESIQRFDIARSASFTAIASRDSGQQNGSHTDSSVAINVGNTCEVLHFWHSMNDSIAFGTFRLGSYDHRSWQTNEYRDLCENRNPNNYINDLNQLRVVNETTQKIMSWATRVRDVVVGQFILPSLYGALGALASIIRELSISVRQIRYSRASSFEYILRVPLGALAGASVGLIITPETLNTAFGLTILGVAFGFGYSVDVFFTLLDSLISRLTQQHVAPQGALQRNPDLAEIAAERTRRSGEQPGT